MNDLETVLKATIRDIPDFPKPGILFKDITPVLSDAQLMHRIVEEFATAHADAGVTAVVGMESRGFIFGAPLAMRLGCAFVPARKPGDLLATGGTASATNQLIADLGAAIVANCFVIELDFLKGREVLGGVPVQSIVHY